MCTLTVMYKICDNISHTVKFRKIQTELWWGNKLPLQLKKESELIRNLTGLDWVSKTFPAHVSICITHCFIQVVCHFSCLYDVSASHESTFQGSDHHVAFPEPGLERRLQPN